jgi:hypothetical protein
MDCRSLTAKEIRSLKPYIPQEDLRSAINHTARVPWYLPRRFGAVVRGNHIYFRPGTYAEDSPAGIALLGHELTHVGQYRNGMTAVSYLCSALRGYMNSRFEKAAYAVQARILRDLENRPA